MFTSVQKCVSSTYLVQSPEAIVDDLFNCIVTNKDKRPKRLARLIYNSDLFGLDTNKYLKALKDLGIKIEDSKEAALDLEGYIKGCSLYPRAFDMVMFDDSQASPPEKKSIDAVLTANIAADLKLYFVTHHFLVMLQRYLLDDTMIRKLHDSGDIIMYFKGSMAHRLVIIKHIEKADNALELFAGLEKYYPCTGDNDFEIKINPKLVNFDEVHKLVGSLVKEFMGRSDLRKLLSHRIFANDDIKRIISRKVVVGGKIYQPQLTTQRDFEIYYDSRGEPMLMYRGLEDCIYTTINKTLHFPSEDLKMVAAFDLYRYKMAFKLQDCDTGIIHDKIYGAEVIDISIPRNYDSKLQAFDFEKAADHFVERKLDYKKSDLL